ncbi:hypothetical protein B0H16DRAFT_1793326 [Mycena metata]|uniref:Uncharacterized protein n=1 Tax=Mycena metata TaxID=1033252 RepID=A0AAD7JMV8_9AGAR|nr:hypothetical protein B0H16DRAFT_1793326 [Mycena metata]
MRLQVVLLHFQSFSTPDEDGQHYVLKFIITSDAAVGKSSLLVRLTDRRFLATPDPTLGVEFGSKLITLPGPESTVVKLQLAQRACAASPGAIIGGGW